MCRLYISNFFSVSFHGNKKRDSGKVIIDRKCVDEYLSIVNWPSLPNSDFIIEDIEDSFPVERINQLLNEK